MMIALNGWALFTMDDQYCEIIMGYSIGTELYSE